MEDIIWISRLMRIKSFSFSIFDFLIVLIATWRRECNDQRMGF